MGPDLLLWVGVRRLSKGVHCASSVIRSQLQKYQSELFKNTVYYMYLHFQMMDSCLHVDPIVLGSLV